MSLVSYQATFSPSDPTVTVSLSISSTDLTCTIEKIEPVTASLQPEGSGFFGWIFKELVGEAAVQEVGKAIASLIDGEILSAIQSIEGTDVSVALNHGDPLSYSFDLSKVDPDIDVEVTLQAQSLSFSTYGGMLEASGTLAVS